MRSEKQVRRKFLSLETQTIKAKNKYKALLFEEKSSIKGIMLLERYKDLLAQKQAYYWILNPHPKNKRNKAFRKPKEKTNKKK